MKNSRQIIEIAQDTLRLEAEAVQNLAAKINENFVSVVHQILSSKGRVIITGIGKSAIIAQKIVATFNSTGTPSVFMHAADAIHGDLGMIKNDDIVICLSKSGNTPEIKVLVPLLKQGGNTLVALVGDINSYLAKQSDYILDTTVDKEACPNNLAPTTSTTAQLAMGDALAVSLLDAREFSPADFARYHPGGALGKRLYLKVADLAGNNEKPEVAASDDVKKVILEITRNRLGVVAVTQNNVIKGIVTDGDLRRMLERYSDVSKLTAADIMSSDPKVIEEDELAVKALELMRNNNITQLLAVSNGQYSGVIHLHDLLKEGII